MRGVSRVRLLDVGAGNCRFANACSRAGFDVTVLEPDERNRSKAAPEVLFRAFPLSEELFSQNFMAGNSFDVITLWQSLEHMPDPSSVISLIDRLLKPGGILFVSVPNLESLQAKLGGNRWAYLAVPHHLTHFTHEGLDRLVLKKPFEVRKRFLFSLEYEVFGWFQTLLNAATGSHNYFYHQAKHCEEVSQKVRHPVWTKIVTAAAPLFVVPAIFLSFISWLTRRTCCIEVAYQKVAEVVKCRF